MHSFRSFPTVNLPTSISSREFTELIFAFKARGKAWNLVENPGDQLKANIKSSVKIVRGSRTRRERPSTSTASTREPKRHRAGPNWREMVRKREGINPKMFQRGACTGLQLTAVEVNVVQRCPLNVFDPGF